MKRHVLELEPTQFAVGLREVDRRIARLESLSPKRLRSYLRARAVPVVVGPERRVYLVDRHHHVRAYWEAGIAEISVDVKADLSHLRVPEFWDIMRKTRWTHLYDEFGGGPHEPEALPEDVRGMADDPFRSLAWAVRRRGGYLKTGEAFVEFQWAEFFRKRLVIAHGDAGFAKALRKALEECRSSGARRLPGYRGK
jgi:hypothetical protein